MTTDPHSSPSDRGSLFQFSVGTFLWLFTLSIVIAWIVRQASQGSEILIALAGLMILVAAFFGFAAVCFLVAWLPAFVAQRQGFQHDRDDPYGVNAEPPSIENRMVVKSTSVGNRGQGKAASPDPAALDPGATL